MSFVGIAFGLIVWFFVRYAMLGFYTVAPNERAVLTTFGRAQRLGDATTSSDEMATGLRPDERERYSYPQVAVVRPGFYWKLPWQQVHKVSVATVTLPIAFDPEDPSANSGGQVLQAVTKDPAGSLRANVSNSTVRCLSNMKLERMLEERHEMSQAVREEASRQSQQWGYKTGSVYIRKVHFRDVGMIAQIEQKVVNRLRQVTAAIQQDGTNRVNVIHSTAEREAAAELAKAAAMRPEIVGKALSDVAKDKQLCDALFDVLETQRMLHSPALQITLIPPGSSLLAEMQAMRAAMARR